MIDIGLVRKHDISHVTGIIEPDFHSRFSLVVSDIFRMERAQCVPTTESEDKVSFVVFEVEVEKFQLLRKSEFVLETCDKLNALF